MPTRAKHRVRRRLEVLVRKRGDRLYEAAEAARAELEVHIYDDRLPRSRQALEPFILPSRNARLAEIALEELRRFFF